MDDKKKKFMMPEVEIVAFSNEDIITTSLVNGNALEEMGTEGNDNEELFS